jgi:hypothetical protein
MIRKPCFEFGADRLQELIQSLGALFDEDDCFQSCEDSLREAHRAAGFEPELPVNLEAVAMAASTDSRILGAALSKVASSASISSRYSAISSATTRRRTNSDVETPARFARASRARFSLGVICTTKRAFATMAALFALCTYHVHGSERAGSSQFPDQTSCDANVRLRTSAVSRGLLGLAQCLVLAALLAACVSVPRAPRVEQTPGQAVAAVARSLVGSPYRFGGSDVRGFDCSGLAVYAYERAGLAIPRTAIEQHRSARPVPRPELAPGDLVFFRIRSFHVNHVGIYVGGGRFIHAPRSDALVSYASLDEGFYRKHFVSAGRFSR